MISENESTELKAMISLLGECCPFCKHDRPDICQMKVLENHENDCFFFEKKENDNIR